MPSLSSLTHCIPPDVLEILLSKFGTVEAFLLSDHSMDSKSAMRQMASEGIVKGLAPPMQDGLTCLNLLSDERTAPRILPTGVSSLDSLLGGGLREGLITELVGESTSGKTQICHHLTAITALRGEHVIYFDTTNSFSPERCLAIARANQDGEDENQQAGFGFDDQGIMERIFVFRCHTHMDLMTQLEILASDLNLSSRNTNVQSPTVLVIDSISAVLTPIFGNRKHAQGEAIMLSVSRMVKNLIKRHQMAAIFTTHITYSSLAGVPGSEPVIRQALGESWRNQASTRLTLSLLNEAQGIRVAERTLSSIAISGQKAYFLIAENGVTSAQTIRQR